MQNINIKIAFIYLKIILISTLIFGGKYGISNLTKKYTLRNINMYALHFGF